MNYKFVNQQDRTGAIILKRTHITENILSVILFLIAIVMLPAGLLLFIDPEDIHQPIFWTGMGLIFLTGGIMISTQIKIPEYLVFDDSSGLFRIKGKKNIEAEQASIPYSEIEGFHVRYHINDNYGYYVVEMIKKDGAFWTIYTSKNKKKADDFCSMLAGRINLKANPGVIASDIKLHNIDVASSGESSVLTWENRYSFKSYCFLILILSSFGMVMYGSRPFAGGIIQYIVAVSFIALLSIVVIVSLINNIGRKHVIEISHDIFSYRKTGGIIKKGSFSLPVGDIGAILFNFSTSRLETVIYILQRGEIDTFQEIMRGTYKKSDLISAVKFMIGVKKIQVGELTIADKINLENLLQKLVEEKSGTHGL